MKALEKFSPRRQETLFDHFGFPSTLPSLMESFWKEFQMNQFEAEEWSPRIDVIENKKNFIIKADLPGIDENKLNVEIKNGLLTLSGHREEEKEYKEGDVTRIERISGSFNRSLSLPDNVDDSKIDATYKKGVLTVTLPKAKESAPKKISVKVK